MVAGKRQFYLFAMIQLLVIMIGVLLTVLAVDHGRSIYRHELLHHAQLIADNCDPDELRTLVQAAEVPASEGRLSLWQQLNEVQHTIPHLWSVSLVGYQQGHLTPLAHSHEPFCEDSCQHTDSVTEDLNALQDLFRDSRPQLLGPLPDERGPKMVVYVPIATPEHQVVAVLALELDAYHYDQIVVIYRLFGLSATSLIALLVLTFQVSIWRSRQGKQRLWQLNQSLAAEVASRQQAEKSLRESESYFRSIFRNTAAGVMIVSPEGRLVMANPALCQVVGYSEEELKGFTLADVTHPEDIDRSLPFYDHQQMGAQTVFETEKRYFCKDGRVVWGRLTGNWVFDDEGQPLHGVLQVVDITEQKRISDQLHAQKELLDRLINHIPEAIYWKDCQSNYLGCNDALAFHAGLSRPEEVVGRREQDLPWAQDGSDRFERCDQQVMASGVPQFAVEESRRLADGRQATVLTSRVPLLNGDDEVIGVLGIFSDITARKQAEQALKQSEQDYKKLYQEFQALLDAMPETIMLIDPDMTVVWANKGALKQFKNCPSLAGRHCFEAWRGLDAPCQGCPVQRCFASGVAEEALLHDGEGHTWSVKAYPLKDEQGNVVNVIDVASDISEKIRMREETDRHSRLASLGELAAGVAHEINNPNGLILLNIPVVQEVFADALELFERCEQQDGALELAGFDYQELRQELPQMLRRIQDGAVRIKRIVEDLKNFVRQGNQDMAAQMDLNEVARAAIRLLDNTIRKATDHFEPSFGVLPYSRGDFQRIEQVIVNLLHNACQALPDRNRRICLMTAYDEEKQCNVLTIDDEGNGIEPEFLARVTDPFYTTKRHQGGTGLGLSISARIIKEHGGHLEIQSQAGRGTKVTIELPLAGKDESI